MPTLRRCQPGQHFNGFLLAPLAVGLIVGGGCVNDVELDEEDQNIDVGAVTRSLFDPTNPVEVLQLIPAPTALAQVDPANQNFDYGPVDLEATAPAPCEGLTSASCLPLAAQGGWPTSLSPELFFSSELVAETASAGIVLLELQENGMPAPLAFSIQQSAVEAPADACLAEAGLAPDSEPVEEFISTNRVTVNPTAGLQENRTYFLFATRDLRGVPRTEDGEEEDDPRPVEPSGLFFLLVQNGPAPVLLNEDGTFTITGSLQTQVEGSVRASLGPEATEEQVQAAIQASAEGLFGLQTFFRGLADAAEQFGLDRQDLVFANTWSTGADAPDLSGLPKVVFAPDPTGANNQTPFPNVPLVTTATTGPDGAPDVQNALPVPPGGGLAAQIVAGLNTINGWGTTTPIALSTTAPIDAMTAPGNVLLIPYDATTNEPIGAPVPVQLQGAPSPTGQDVNGRDIYALTVQPLEPLRPDTFYALGIISGPEGLRDTMGRPLVIDDTFQPLTQTSSTAARLLVACGGFAETGMFPSDAELDATLGLIEDSLARSRWQPAFEVFESLEPSVPRQALSTAVPYKTQSITDTLDLIDNTLLPNVYGMLPDPSGRPPVVSVPLPDLTDPTQTVPAYEGPAAQTFICSALCSQGLFEIPLPPAPTIPRAQCLADIPALLSHPLCTLTASDVDEVRLFDVRNYTLTAGNPVVAGTFTPQTVQAPAVTRMPVWYIAGGGTPPAEGRPVAIFQHGLTRAKEDVVPVANTFAGINDEGGWGLFSMDLPFHGARASDIQDNATGDFCPTVNPLDVTCDPTTNDCVDSQGNPPCDGIQDTEGAGYIGLNVFAIRDNVRQSTVDHLTLLDHIRQDRFTAVNGDIDTDRVGYAGLSLGGIVGGVTAAYADDLESVSLSATGGSWTTILLNSVPSFTAPLFAALAEAGICTPVDPQDITQGCQSTPAFNQFLLLAQTAMDPGDPLAVSAGVVDGAIPGRMPLGTDPILMQMVLPDGVVPNVSSFLLGGAYGFVDLATQMPTSPQFTVYDVSATPGADLDASCHGLLISPIATDRNLDGSTDTAICGEGGVPLDAICNTLGMQEQAATWIDSAAMTVAPNRPASVLGLPCP